MFGLLRKLENSEPSHKLDYKMYRTVQIDKTLFFIVLTLSKQILPKFVFQRCNQTSDWDGERVRERGNVSFALFFDSFSCHNKRKSDLCNGNPTAELVHSSVVVFFSIC